MVIKILNPEDRHLHEEMSKQIVANLPREDFLIPMSEAEYDETFKKGSPDVVYALFEGENMVATSSMLHDVRDYASEPEMSDILLGKCIEIGECMVLPSHRGQNLMFMLNNLIIDTARERGVEYILATAHPDNIASNTSLQHLGLKLIKTFDRHGYLRNLYAMKL
ncbi:MAG: GNAT family N-acetyltransferase [Bacteroidaceae bacterium]|jgi:RimJ/RimL family protein N-acetyltransferase|nr:GNAT family N-acetyltransferase [Bacteroidaceae bacterium]